MRRVIITLSCFAVAGAVLVGTGATAGASPVDVDAFSVGRAAGLAVGELVAGRSIHTTETLSADRIAELSTSAFIPPATVTVPAAPPASVEDAWSEPIVSYPAPVTPGVGDAGVGPIVSYPSVELETSLPDGATWTAPIASDGAKEAGRGAEMGFTHPSDTDLSR